MKSFYVIIISLILSLSTLSGTKQDIRKFSKLAGDSVTGYTHGEVKGFSAKEISNFYLPKKFIAYLNKKESDSKKKLLKFIKSAPDEYQKNDYYKAKKSPTKFLGVDYLFDIEVSYKIFKNGKLIGYAVTCSDHVDAEMIQDGSWVTIYFDTKKRIVAEEAGQS